YAAIYCDATFISVKRNTVQKEALHVLLGITPSGQKEVLDYIIRPSESLDAYNELLTSIKKRGVKSVLLFISDGFIGLKDLCLTQYPAAKFQRCWVHILRHIQKLIRRKDLAVIMRELKMIYQATSYEQATSILGIFLTTWQPIYPKLQGILSDITDLFTYYEFPTSIRASIYTTNIIEQFNKHLKRTIGKKEQFPNEASLERFVCSYANEYNAKFFERTHRGFAQARIDL
ncbi:transposase, partial [Veillonella sp. R32]|uniref:IS256 family transposase n=1 Tax=Veillonella sp. R32 TaxID=2021312 RepID=UPI00192EC6F1